MKDEVSETMTCGVVDCRREVVAMSKELGMSMSAADVVTSMITLSDVEVGCGSVVDGDKV